MGKPLRVIMTDPPVYVDEEGNYTDEQGKILSPEQAEEILPSKHRKHKQIAPSSNNVTTLSPAVTQFTNNPAMAAVTHKYTNREEYENDPDWTYLPNADKRMATTTYDATDVASNYNARAGDPEGYGGPAIGRLEAVLPGGGGYSGDPESMGAAMAFAKQQEDLYAESIAVEEREKREIAESPQEPYDPVGWREAAVEVLGYEPLAIDADRETDREMESFKRQLFTSMGLTWGVSYLTPEQEKYYSKEVENKRPQIRNKWVAKRKNGLESIDSITGMMEDKWKNDDDIRKEATRKKELEEKRVEEKRKFGIQEKRLGKDKEPKETPKQKQKRAKELFDYKERAKSKKPLTPSEVRQRAKDLVGAEAEIMANTEEEWVKSYIDFHNRFSNPTDTEVWVWKVEEVEWGFDIDKAQKVKLPIIRGKQVTMKDVRDTAQKHKASIKEILKKLGVL